MATGPFEAGEDEEDLDMVLVLVLLLVCKVSVMRPNQADFLKYYDESK
jgi:hypothetical protein